MDTQTASELITALKNWLADNAETLIEDNEELRDFAKAYFQTNEAVGDVFKFDQIRDHVQWEHKPSDIFTDDQLEEWALANGFVLED